MLTRAFANLRDRTSLHPAVNPPTLHEIRGLGANLYRKAGWEDSAVQLLLGHATESMTRGYLDKHKPDTVVTPIAGLRL